MRTGTRRGDGSPPRPLENATITAIAGGYLNYYPSAEAADVLNEWQHGAEMEWDVDDDTGQPAAIYLTPATKNGFTLRRRDHQRPHFALPTSGVELTDLARDSHQIEEEVEVDKISIRVTFAQRQVESSPETAEEVMESVMTAKM